MLLPIHQIDAFTDQVFGGNPAAVVPLDTWLDDAVLAAIAAENNLSETAFLVPHAVPDGAPSGTVAYGLRWFTPAVEVDLCGHATLASAWLVLQRLAPTASGVSFSTRSGWLHVGPDPAAPGRLQMDFPAQVPVAAELPVAGLAAALGATPSAVLCNVDVLAVFDDAATVRSLVPDIGALAQVEARGVIVTAPGDEAGVDFVSRFFAPRVGVPEDPVTGSAHCKLVPYWAGRLGRTVLRARQVSRRGGDLWCELDGERVHLAGHAVSYLEGTISC